MSSKPHSQSVASVAVVNVGLLHSFAAMIPISQSWTLFKADMDSMFSDVHEKEDLSQRLQALKQSVSALNFVTEFQTVTSLLKLNDETKILLFKAVTTWQTWAVP
jgi:hypothetical protein